MRVVDCFLRLCDLQHVYIQFEKDQLTYLSLVEAKTAEKSCCLIICSQSRFVG